MLRLLEWADRRKGLGCKQLSAQESSQGCPVPGIVFSQSPAELGAWRGQACHSVPEWCIWTVAVLRGSLCVPHHPHPHLTDVIIRGREARALASC